MIENEFVKDLIRPFYEMMGERALEIIYSNFDIAKKKFKSIDNFEKSGFNSKIIFDKNTSENEKNIVLSFMAKKCYEDFNKEVGSITKPMMNFILSNYKGIQI